MKRLLFILLLIGTTCQAQTRFYLPSTGTAPISPTPGNSHANGAWTVTAGVDYISSVTSRINSTMTSKTTAQMGGVATRSVINRVYISPPLQAQTITKGTSDYCRIQIRCNVDNATSTTMYWCLRAKVVSSDGLTERGILLSRVIGSYGTNDVLTTTLTNRGTEAMNVRYRDFGNTTNVVCSAGDYIVWEIGAWYSSGTNTTRTVTQSFGDDSGTDLPENTTTTAANNPWIQTSQTILFQTPPPVVTGNAMMLSSD